MKLVIFTAALAPAPVALAEGDEPPASPAVKLVTNGLVGGGNAVLNKPPANFVIKNSIDDITLGHTSMRDFGAMSGATVHSYDNAGDKVSWLCLESPAGGTAPATQIWVFAEDVGLGPGKISAVSAEAAPATPPAACAKLDKPFAADFNAPSLGAKLDELSAKFGPVKDRDPDGTTAFIYGAVQKLPQHLVLSAMYKYAFTGDGISAVSAQVFQEEE